MKIQLFKNMKGLIHGDDPKRIGCDRGGILKIGTAEYQISAEGDNILPLLFHGSTGDFKATFTDNDGNVYELEKVAVRAGRIAPPPPTTVEIMELHCRIELLEDECVDLRRQIDYLNEIFDTNSLNFLIK